MAQTYIALFKGINVTRNWNTILRMGSKLKSK